MKFLYLSTKQQRRHSRESGNPFFRLDWIPAFAGMTNSKITQSLALCTWLLLPAHALAEPADYTFDTDHTRVLFRINHAGFSDFIGQFKKLDGTLNLDLDKPETSQIQFRVRPDSIETNLPNFNEELQGKDWFNSTTYPYALFKSTKIVRTGDDGADVTGDFTLLGQTHPLTLHVVHHKHGKDGFKNVYKAGFSITGHFKRSEWGMTNFVPVVGDDVSLVVEAEMMRPLKKGE